MAAKKLTEKRQRFIEEYLVDLNATQAAIRAGFSKKTAYSQGQRLLKDVDVQRLISEAQQARSERTQVTSDWVVDQLAMLAGFDLTEVLERDDQGRMVVRDLTALPKRLTGAIESITQTSTERQTADGAVVEKVRLQVKAHSKVSALRMLMDHLGMDAPKKQEVTGKDGGPMEVDGPMSLFSRLGGRQGVAERRRSLEAERGADDDEEGSE